MVVTAEEVMVAPERASTSVRSALTAPDALPVVVRLACSRRALDGLKVDPCIPHTLSGFTVTRRFRGAVYHITVDNAAGVQHGIKAVTVDGKAISGNVLPLAAAGTEVTVQVTMG